MALLVGDQDRCTRPKFPFTSPSVNGEQLHYLSHAVLLVKSAHCFLLNSAGCWFFFFPQILALVQLLSLLSGRETWLFGFKLKKSGLLKECWNLPLSFSEKKWPNQPSYYTILWPVTNTWVGVYLQGMLAGAGGSHWLVLFTAPRGAGAVQRPPHRCSAYLPKRAVNHSGGRGGWKNAHLQEPPLERDAGHAHFAGFLP